MPVAAVRRVRRRGGHMVPARFHFPVSISVSSAVRPGLKAGTYVLVLVVLLTAIAAATASAGDEDRGVIAGTVLDPDGRPVANADVLLAQAASIAARARTDDSGRFRADRLLPGRYELRVVVDGFGVDPQTLTIAAGETREVDVRLHLTAVSESAVVSAWPLAVAV